MANHCWNWASFSGSKSNIKAFKKALADAKKIEDKGFRAQAFLITNQMENPKKDWGTRWWDWQIHDSDPEYVALSGDSAWSPPIEFVQGICEEYFLTCEIEYEESGCDFGGRTTIDKDGKIIEEEDYTYTEWMYRTQMDSFFESVLTDLEDEYYKIEDLKKEHPYISKEIEEELKKAYNEGIRT